MHDEPPTEGGDQGFGTLDVTVVFDQWAKLDAFYRDVLVPADANRDLGLTARKFDESQAAGHRVYIAAHSAITNAMEHVEALQTLLIHRATPRAPWTLLRAVFEAGFWATWILDPEDGFTRRTRALRYEVEGARQRTAFYADFFKHAPADLTAATAEHPKHEKTYRDEAAAMGTPWEAIRRKIVVANELPHLRVVRTMEDDSIRNAMIATWRSLSGMQHGYAYAVVLGTDEHNPKPIQGGSLGTRTIADNAFTASASAATWLVFEAMNLFVERCTRP